MMASNIPNNYTQTVCRYFKMDGFCKHMEDCKFRHDNKIDISLQSKKKESEETNAYNGDKKSDEKSLKIQKETFVKNNKLCRYFKLDSFCKKGEMCNYAHISNSLELNAENSPKKAPKIKKNSVTSKKEKKYAELAEGIKRAEGPPVDKEILQNCKHFMSKKGCRHGNKCTFKHYRSTSDAADELIVTTDIESINNEAFRAQDLHPINDELVTNKVRIMKSNHNNLFSVNSKKVVESYLENRNPSVKMSYRSYNEKSCYKADKYQSKHACSKPLVEQTSLELAVQEEADVEALVTAAVSNCKLEENLFNKNFKDDKICPFFLKNQICSKSDTCDLLHPNTSNTESYDMQEINKAIKDVTNISKSNNEKLLNHRKLCKFFLSESGCRRKNLCKYLHEDVKVENFHTLETSSIDKCNSGEKFHIKKFEYENTLVSPALQQLNNVKSLENLVDFKKLRSTELQQLEKRFKNKFQWSTYESSDIYIVSIEPSDPDWPFIVKSFNLRFSFPKDYPQELFKVSLENKNGEYPDGFAEYMDDNLQDWLEKRKQERSETDLAFRPFIRWFDRNLETLFTSSATKVKRQQDAMRAGIMLIPHHKILKNSQTVSTSFESTPQSLITNGAAISDHSMVLEDNAIDGAFQKTDSDTNSSKFTSLQVKKGTEIKFVGMSIVNAGTLKLIDIVMTVQCDRCKLKADIKLKDQVSLVTSCKKCNTLQAVVFHSELMHQYSHVAGYLHLNGCKAFELILSDSIVILTCFECTKDNLLKGLTYGSVRHHWCTSCHGRMDIEVPATQFNVLQPAGASVLDIKLKPPSKLKAIRDPSVKDGEPLPENGACRHYKKSYRWLRFPCCGKLFACDKCHEESSNDGHEMLFATKMLCGFCAKEQPFSKDKPCVRCASNTTRSRSSHWEGGKGCRDAVKMARGDKRKSAGLGKTISRKHKVDNSKQ